MERAVGTMREYGHDGAAATPSMMREVLTVALEELASSPEGRAWLARLAFPPEQLRLLVADDGDHSPEALAVSQEAYETLSAALGSASEEDQ